MKRSLSLILCVIMLCSLLPIGGVADVIPDISESAIVSVDGTTTTYNVDLLDESQLPVPETSTQMSSSLSRSDIIPSSAEESGFLDENDLVPVDIGASIQAESSELADESILKTDFQEKADFQEMLEANPQMMLLSEGEGTAYNSVIGPTAKNIIKQPEFAMNGAFSEYVSPYSGEMSMQATDLNLTGRNGLNLGISRLYQTNQSDYGEKFFSNVDGVSLHGYSNSTYDQDRYALGAGWSFGYPSVEVRTEDDIQALYYHTGTGNVFKVNFDDPSVYGNLENLTTLNLMFNYCNSNYTYNNGQETSAYYAKTIDGTCQYFADDGRLLGIRDRFGNYLNFKHTNMAVSNILLNPTFITPDATSADVWTRSTTKNSYSSDTMRYTSTTRATSNATSAYAEVEPGENYIFNGWYKLLGTALNSYDGTVNITMQRYDGNKAYLGSYTISSQYYNTTANQLENIVQEFPVGGATKYIKVVLENNYAKGDMFFDNVCVDKANPLITEIADQVGRKLTFDYGDYIYSYSPVNSNITVTLTSEKEPDLTRTFTYERDRTDGTSTKYYNGSYFKQKNDHWVLLSFIENEQTKQQYGYNITGYSNADPNITDPNLREYFSFIYATKNESRDASTNTKALITDVFANNTKIKYEYERTTKKLGYTGYYQTQRVKKRYENYAEAVNNVGVWNSTVMNQKTFTYVNDETDYGNNNGIHTVSINQTNGLNTSYQYNDNLLTYKNDNDTITGETVSQYHYYEDSSFWNMPSQIKTTRTKSGESIVSYQFYNYNYWGGIEKETLPMTESEKTNNKAKFTITYDYHCSTTDDSVNYAIPSKKTWYNDLTGSLMEETVTFDSLDRPVSVTNAKGEVTSYTYDTTYNWLPAMVTQTDINNMHGLAAVSYTKKYQWDSGVYPYKIIENDGTDREKTYLYNFIYDRTKKMTDEDSKVTDYYYDEFGRILEIWYPSVRGTSTFTLQEKFAYAFGVYTATNNRILYRVRSDTYLNNQSVIKRDSAYYNDYGQELYKIVSKVSGSKTQKTDYDTYYRPIKQTDFNGNYVTIAYDAYNRAVETTDMANNKSNAKYGINTVETYFKGANLAEENHSLQTMDIRGNVISKSIYPNGRASTPITQNSTYNIIGNLKTYTDGKGNETTFEYDKIGQLIKTKLPGTTDTQYNTTNYSKNGQSTFDRQIDGANSNRTAVLYNSRYLPSLRMDSSANASTETESYTYDKRGKLSSKIDRKSNTTDYLYDNFGNLKTSTVGTDIINLYYSPYGNVGQYSYTNHPVLAKTFDEFGRTTVKYDAGVEAINQTKYRYDDTSKLKGVTDPFQLDVAYDYNTLNRLTTVTTSDAKNFVYDYYADGMVKSLTYPTSGIKTEYTYDNANRILTVITKKGTEVKASFTYTYDDNSNIATVKDKNNATTTYDYDPQNRLTSVIYPTKTVSYIYDAFGNRQTVTDSISGTKNSTYKGNQLANDGTKSYTYDKNGNLLSDGETTYGYDDRNKLISSTKNGVTTTYTYNAEGLRTDKNNKWYHLDENGRVIAESIVDNGVTLQAETVWADKPLARKINGVYYYYIYNAHNDVIAMIDEAGNIVNSYEYDAWGNTVSQVEGIANPIKYAGEFQDSETGLYYLRARYYDPKIGKFTQEDPIRDEKNWYAFCGNNPVNYVDPTGTKYYAIRDLIEQSGCYIEVYWHADTQTAVLSTGVFYTALSGSTTFIDPTDGRMYIWVPDGESPTSYVFLPGNDSVTDEGWMIVAAAAGGTIVVKAGIAIAGALGEVATVKAAEMISKADRIGRALETDTFHRSCSYLTQEQLKLGQAFTHVGGDKATYTLFQVAGEVNGKSGIFEYLVNSSNQITHQMFVINGVVNGILQGAKR